MNIREIMPGVKLVETDQASILFGCPPEVIKFLITNQNVFPSYIVLPDTIYKRGIVQNSTEFPLYYFLFEMQNVRKGKKLGIIGTEETCRNNRDLLSLTLFGPTVQQYKAIGHSRYFNRLYKEAQYLAPRKSDGTQSTIDDFIETYPFVDGAAETGMCTVQHEGVNVYSINGMKIDINFDGEQYPPYDLGPDFTPRVPLKFGIDVLG
ncbi:MAG: Crp/Fnr family transcriptional regulator, partial [Spirochaetota bacterium]